MNDIFGSRVCSGGNKAQGPRLFLLTGKFGEKHSEKRERTKNEWIRACICPR